MEFNLLGFTVFDIALLLACTFGAVIGSLVQAILATIDHDGPPTEPEHLRIAPPEIQETRGLWINMRLFVGGVLGFVFGLYFIGMLNDSPSTFARIWALSFVVGYAAPKVWGIKNDRLVAQLKSEDAGV
ncbi:hypothetical protein LRS11_10880 [Pseudomonas sp. J452]|uniref:hypothetical protein n=1 Tax=Pseudomonas sp. J452 TaxID=2898441 RepID=UPI0021AE2FB3|nr:hypothetical protein [Pseudomonas sp. J452]UUY10491.1 hypothetical protein LRS11_10880 [Pseudomonas sp. J452]